MWTVWRREQDPILSMPGWRMVDAAPPCDNVCMRVDSTGVFYALQVCGTELSAYLSLISRLPQLYMLCRVLCLSWSCSRQ